MPTFLTVFTIVASVEIAARLRGGKGMIGWVKALPWDNPMMLAVTFSFVMLGFGGAGGIINMSYQLNETIHNTQWVTGHFHLIFAGAIVIMYFMIAYDLWPQLTQLPRRFRRASSRLQLWTWFLGMLVLTMPWHLVGLLGMPRRMAYFDYTHPDLQAQAWTVTVSTIGGFVLVVSGAALHLHPGARAQGRRRARALHVQRSRASGRENAARAQRLRDLGGDDDRADGRELRLPDRAARDAEGNLGAGRAHGRAVMAAPHDPASRRYVLWSVVSLVVLTLVTLLVGFVWLPSAHPDFSAQGHLGGHLPRGRRPDEMGRIQRARESARLHARHPAGRRENA